MAIVEDWLNEDDNTDDGAKPIRRSSRIVLNGRNSIYSHHSVYNRNAFLASLDSKANSDLDSENTKISSQSLVNINPNNKRRLSLVSKSIGGSLQVQSLDNNTVIENTNTIDEENVDLKQQTAEIRQNLKSKSNLSAKLENNSTTTTPPLPKSKSTTNIKNITPKQTTRLLKLRQNQLVTSLKPMRNFNDRKALNEVEIKE